jgi:molybdopterin synthase catalytic subunit
VKALSIVGPSDSETASLVEELATVLSGQGSVATVKCLDDGSDLDTDEKPLSRHRDAGATTTYGLTDSDGWVAVGQSLSLEEALDRLAPDHEYVLVEGYAGEGLPTVALGDAGATDPVLTTAPTANAVDVEELVDVVEDLEPLKTLSSLVARAKQAEGADRSGAIATFTGRVRRRDHPDDPPTEYLEFEKYEWVAEKRMAAIRDDLTSRDCVHEVLLHHRTGVVEAGEDIVFVVVLAGHRAEAFRAVEDGIDRLKQEVPLFKKEVTVESEFWRHEKPNT